MAKPWGNGSPVIMSDSDKDVIVREVVSAVTQQNMVQVMEQFKQFTLTKAQLDDALREVARQKEIIAQLEVANAQLQQQFMQVLSSRTQIQPDGVYPSPTSVVTQPVPSYDHSQLNLYPVSVIPVSPAGA